MNKFQLINIFRDTMDAISSNPRLLELTERAKSETALYPENFQASNKLIQDEATEISVIEEQSFAAAQNLCGESQRVAVLNFASAVQPGGGVTIGAKAQEECLCRISNLYPCLSQQHLFLPYYQYHRALQNNNYSDKIIYSRDITVFKSDTDDPQFIEAWYSVDVITCAAPNLIGVHNPNQKDLQDIFESRIRNILEVAIENKVTALVLGAFGCGAFRNPPTLVAAAFMNVLEQEGYKKHFKNIVFAVKRTDAFCPNIAAFQEVVYGLSEEVNKLRFVGDIHLKPSEKDKSLEVAYMTYPELDKVRTDFMSYCSKCGAQNADTAAFCSSCGQPTAPAAQPQGYYQQPPQPQIYGQPMQGQPYYAPPTTDYTRMGGWLCFFMVLCIIDAAFAIIGVGLINGLVAVIKNMISYSSYMSGAYGAIAVVSIITSLIVLAAAFIEIVFVVQVFKKNPKFLKMYQICKIVSIAASLIGYIVPMIIWGHFYAGSSLTGVIRDLIAGGTGLLLMTLYYCKSKRVRTYMGSDAYMKNALFAFKDATPIQSGYVQQQPYYQPQSPQQPFQQQPIYQPPLNIYQQPAQTYAQPAQQQYTAGATTVLNQVEQPPVSAVVFCANCGKQFNAGEAQCPHCGMVR